MSLDGEERKKIISDILNEAGRISVKDLYERFGVSRETVRRDLDALESEKKLKKVYGGAVKITSSGQEPPYLQRSAVYENEKRRIGRKAAGLIDDNDVVFIDVGTTTLHIIPHLSEKRNVTVVTNSVPVLNMLIEMANSKRFDGSVFFVGGEINTEQMSSFGPIAETAMDNLYISKAFIPTCGVSIEFGLTSFDSREANFSRKLMLKSRQSFVLTDSSKLGIANLHRFADLSEIDVVICDSDAPEGWKEALDRKDVTWLIAD